MKTRSLALTLPLVSALGALALAPGCWFLSPASCITSENCPDASVCVASSCIDPVTAGLKECSSAADCGDGEACDTLVGYCVTGFVSGGFCTDDSSCGGGVCVESVCLTAEEAENPFIGDLEVTDDDSWATLEAATAVLGSLYIGGDAWDETEAFIVIDGDVNVPNLRRVDGAIEVNYQVGLTSISFPVLKVIDGSVSFEGNTGLRAVSLPAFDTIPSLAYSATSGSLDVSGSPLLESLAAPSLANIGWITLDTGEAPEGVTPEPLVMDFASLSEVGNVDLYESASAIEVSFPSLVTIHGRLYMNYPSFTQSLSFPELVDVGEDFHLYASGLTILDLPKLASVGIFNVDGNDALTAITLPALGSVAQSMTITGNPALVTLELPALTSVNNQITITDNEQLDVCLAKALVDAASPGGAVDLSGNQGDESACP